MYDILKQNCNAFILFSILLSDIVINLQVSKIVQTDFNTFKKVKEKLLFEM